MGNFWENIGKNISTTTERLGRVTSSISEISEQVSNVAGIVGSSVSQVSSIWTSKNKTEPQKVIYEHRQKIGCFIATETYGQIGLVPEKFYHFRDNLPDFVVRTYYEVSPHFIPIMRDFHLHKPVKILLNLIVR